MMRVHMILSFFCETGAARVVIRGTRRAEGGVLKRAPRYTSVYFTVLYESICVARECVCVCVCACALCMPIYT